MHLYTLEGARYVPVNLNSPVLEAQLHASFDANLPTLLGVTPLRREFKAGSGRMDTLGVDQNGFPVIIEYKRSQHASPLLQILSYQGWINANREAVEPLYAHLPYPIDWRGLRLICVAPSFNQHDVQALDLLQANIDLVEFSLYEGGLLGLNMLASHRLADYPRVEPRRKQKMSFDQHLASASPDTVQLYNSLINGMEAQGIILSSETKGSAMIWSHFGEPVMRLTLGKTTKAQLRCELNVTEHELTPRIEGRFLPSLVVSKTTQKGLVVRVFDHSSLSALLHFIEVVVTLKSLANDYL